ncbi:Rad52/Rad22 family DNA repair protein [Aquibacillus sp. 3ASR75-11]|uniref:Rad52/Rad22 family DNA repair protein n=1 Tax=Terrihalobacillus insolitus TaxID=2950438 RepID=A0A9X3WVV0_9BACI|nr:Rad52/Rad22 family DNA repair protein [Terrihalobacillus insolitus]MDC3424279.1 Rad52/Rad22 family DNA repair protein [Terrihalobacillus insolitus]
MGEENCMNMEEIQRRLAEPFPPEDIEWRVTRGFQSNNKVYAWVVPYVESRAIMNRLDTVLGIANWEDEYQTLHNGVICGIRIWFSDSKSRIKWDGADLTNVEATKGGLSSALKRAAVQWGIGRYLYNLQEECVEIFQDTRKGNNFYQDKKKNIRGSWNDPKLPDWALPEGFKGKQGNTKRGNPNQSQQGQQQSNGQPDRNQLLTFINRFEYQVGLSDKPDYIVRIFNKANNSSIQNPADIKQKASMGQLSNYYNALKPVRDICAAAQKSQISIDEIVNYAQIVKTNMKVDNLMSLFFNLNGEEVKKIIQIARQEFLNRNNQHSA